MSAPSLAVLNWLCWYPHKSPLPSIDHRRSGVIRWRSHYFRTDLLADGVGTEALGQPREVVVTADVIVETGLSVGMPITQRPELQAWKEVVFKLPTQWNARVITALATDARTALEACFPDVTLIDQDPIL
jgi:hypothetical protein